MILVTGGAGFVGAATVGLLRARGHRVRVLDDLSTGDAARLRGLGAELVRGDVRDALAVERALRGCAAALHLAARSGGPASWEQVADYASVNVDGTRALLEAARRQGVRRLVLASSAAVYGNAPSPQHEELQPAPATPYAVSKLLAEELFARASRDGLSCLVLRYFNVFGPGQEDSGPGGPVVPRFVSRALRGEPLPLEGSGLQERDFVSVLDVARANLLALEGSAEGVVNVGSGRSLSVRELALRVSRAVGVPLRVLPLPPRAGDSLRSRASLARARRLLGWNARLSFEHALALTVDWHRRGRSSRLEAPQV